MQDVRCPNCAKLLCRMEPSDKMLEIKCTRCGLLIGTKLRVMAVILPMERQHANADSG